MRTTVTRFLAAAVLLAGTRSVFADVHYVDVNSTDATPPYTNWSTAATQIQAAVDAAVAGDEIVVTNGTYSTGGDGWNRVAVDKPMTIRSVNGPQFAIINGGGAGPCVYLTSNASLSGFTLINGFTFGEGGGAYGGTLNNCTLTNNWILGEGSPTERGGGGAAYCTLNNCTLTHNYAYYISGGVPSGGGAYFCTLNNCTLTGNSAEPYPSYGGGYEYGGGAAICTLNNCILTGNSSYAGGGAYFCTLNNCTLTGNSAVQGGGTDFCWLTNCTLVGNSAEFSGGALAGMLNNCVVYYNGNESAAPMNYCCTMSLPTSGTGNITNSPLFVDTNGWANLRLQPNSPCINAGNNSYITNATDLDGNPRISGGTVDIGAYEYQCPQLTLIPYGANVLLLWPTNNAEYDYTGFTVQSTTNLIAPVVWTTNSPAPIVLGGLDVIFNPMSGPQQFYRLVQ